MWLKENFNLKPGAFYELLFPPRRSVGRNSRKLPAAWFLQLNLVVAYEAQAQCASAALPPLRFSSSPFEALVKIAHERRRAAWLHEAWLAYILCLSPELLGVLSSIAAFMALMALFFLYLSNKLSVERPADLSHLSGYENNTPAHAVMLALHPSNDNMSASVPLMR
ncbi:hypothetical protein EYF80_037422 [Liparis tanakae]|uniref:Uncharacterized protein n=1 Tax=Liparis tanakae TaxID=230148 RepID=A0A4Z2GG61_9TELE|nr:hypothetical protein EYF80_037422 [Liparis tanakae]